jgi:glycosyltransferase involved in cell wall biosynthesis
MRLAWVLPRYGSRVLGGAEAHARAIIEQLSRRGHFIEVWTTCALSVYSWENELSEGVEQEGAVTIRRFPIDVGGRINFWADPFTVGNQYLWIETLPHSSALCEHIQSRANEFDLLMFMPYSAGTTYHGARIFPRKSIIWTCLHDELQAYLLPTRDLLQSVAGLILNCRAEQEFLQRVLRIQNQATAIVGMYFEMASGDAAAFRRAYPWLPSNFIIYAGRWESGKNVDVLIQYYLWYQSRRKNEQLGLVLLGDGPLGKFEYPGVFKLGFVDEQTKRNALAACSFLCQPSLAESFSIVLMEAWMQGKPVLVNQHCAVTLEHVRTSNGGLYFADYSDFEGAVDYLLTHPVEAKQMGENGRRYVAREYNVEIVMNRMEEALKQWLALG